MLKPWFAALALSVAGCATPMHGRFDAVTPKPAVENAKAREGAPKAASSKTIVLIHGMFMTPASWEPWKQYFEAQGYRVYAPGWPLHDAKPADLRAKQPDPLLGKVTLAEVVASYREFVKHLEEKPILIGHSMGGLVVQLLLQEHLGAAGIAIDSAAPNGLLSLRWSFLRSNWPVISPFEDESEAVLLDEDQFNYAFTDCLAARDAARVYREQAVPESRLVGKGALSETAKVAYRAKAAPLLIIAGEDDHIIPPSLNYKNFEAYEGAPSVTEFKQFPGRCHWIVGQSGWQDVAGYVRQWLKAN